MLQALTTRLDQSFAMVALVFADQFKDCPNLVWMTPMNVEKYLKNPMTIAQRQFQSTMLRRPHLRRLWLTRPQILGDRYASKMDCEDCSSADIVP